MSWGPYRWDIFEQGSDVNFERQNQIISVTWQEGSMNKSWSLVVAINDIIDTGFEFQIRLVLSV